MGGKRARNLALRTERELRNWSLDDAARELRTLMTSKGETQVGVTLNSVNRWELGTRRPDPRYRRYLCLLYGKRPDQLGFLPEECQELAEQWPDDFTSPQPPAEQRQIQATSAPTAKMATVAESNGATSSLVLPRPDRSSRLPDPELELLNLRRRQLLRAFGLLGLATGAETIAAATDPLAGTLDRAARIASGQAAADDALIADLQGWIFNFERARRRVAANLLIEPVRAHIGLVKAILRQPMLPDQRDALLSSASQATSMMSWLAFFDQGNRHDARHWLAESIQLGEEANDPHMQVLGLIRAAEQATYNGQGDQSIQILEHARNLAERVASPNTLSWVLAAQAEAFATLHRPQACPELLDLAARAQQRADPNDEPSWSEYWGRSKVAGYIGAVYMRLDNPGPARAALYEALAELEPAAVKYRSIYLVDLAMTHAQEAEVEQAVELAAKALEIAGPMHYGTTLERMDTLLARLSSWSGVRKVKELRDQLRTLRPPA